MAPKLPLIRGLGGLPKPKHPGQVVSMMSCSECDVTWRDLPGAPCWFCGETGEVANPKRLVLD